MESGWRRLEMPASPSDAAEAAAEAARDGARDGTAVGRSSVAPEITGRVGREKTGVGPESRGGKLEDGEGAVAREASACWRVSESLTVLSAKASISSVEDCVSLTSGGFVVVKGSGELRSECAVAREPGPEDCEEELDSFLDDFVERAPPRNREASTSDGESLGNHGFLQEQQEGVTHVAHA